MSAAPLVSICLPNFRTRAYLAERLETIFAQTLTDWELIVLDAFSDDGAWEYLVERAKTEPRMHVSQAPRSVPPFAWNECLPLVRGRYVYFATSDDTMAPDCLEKLVAALEANPGCGLAHCPARLIDETGRDSLVQWRDFATFVSDAPEWVARRHIRHAPHDALLHLVGQTVYISITQLLIRKALFDQIGGFSQTWKTQSDFHWGMRAALVTDTIHVPDTWGGWRLHGAQATAAVDQGSDEHWSRMQSMIDDAIEVSRPHIAPVLYAHLRGSWRTHFSARRAFQADFDRQRGGFARSLFLLRRAVSGSRLAWSYVARKAIGVRGWPEPTRLVLDGWRLKLGVTGWFERR